MKKILVIGSLVIVGILIFGAVGIASAQTLLPRLMGERMAINLGTNSSRMAQQTTGTGMMSGGRGGMMGQAGSGLLHDYMVTGFAAAFNMSVEDLQARIDAGETMRDVALSLGMTLDEFNALWIAVRTDAINQALADGVITQEQADWMLSRIAMRQAGGGTGTCTGACQMGGRGGMRGAGRGSGACLQP